ncbi:MAG: hypothetical protein J6C31_05295 [Prevotella sp.]|nr:hypothetical protein [Prevotella sp.]
MIDINKFNDLEDLPISEEMLGAYLEGNLHGSEFREVNNFIQSAPMALNLIDTVEDDMNFLNSLDLSYQGSVIDANDSEDMFSAISLPEISAFGTDSFIETSSSLNDDILLGSDCHEVIDDVHFFNSDGQDNNHLHHDPELDSGLIDNNE